MSINTTLRLKPVSGRNTIPLEDDMARKGDEQRLNEIRDIIIDNPGKRPGWLARRLGFDNKTMMRALTQLEDRGDLLIEDERGRLSWFGRKRI